MLIFILYTIPRSLPTLYLNLRDNECELVSFVIICIFFFLGEKSFSYLSLCFSNPLQMSQQSRNTSPPHRPPATTTLFSFISICWGLTDKKVNMQTETSVRTMFTFVLGLIPVNHAGSLARPPLENIHISYVWFLSGGVENVLNVVFFFFLLTSMSSVGHWAYSGWGSSGPVLSSCSAQTPEDASSPPCWPPHLSITKQCSETSPASNSPFQSPWIWNIRALSAGN